MRNWRSAYRKLPMRFRMTSSFHEGYAINGQEVPLGFGLRASPLNERIEVSTELLTR
jgi:hypothetical protein